jgi:hypothetical protein
VWSSEMRKRIFGRGPGGAVCACAAAAALIGNRERRESSMAS